MVKKLQRTGCVYFIVSSTICIHTYMYMYMSTCTCTYIYIHVNGQSSISGVGKPLRIARKRAVNIHPESRSKSGQISIFLLTPHDRDTLGGRFVPCRPEGAGVLGKHLQLVRKRSIIKEVRSLLVPSSISPSRPASPPPPPRPRAQRCAGAFPPPPVYLFHS